MSRYILVSEDDNDILNLVTQVLEDAGFEVGSAVGPETIEAVEQRRPDVLLLDYQMPGMDGVHVARALRSQPQTRDVPIVAMTAAGRVAVLCQEMDADGYLGKPFDIDHLVEIVNEMIHATD